MCSNSRILFSVLLLVFSVTMSSAQIFSLGLRAGGGVAGTYYKSISSFNLSGIEYSAGDIFNSRSSMSLSVSLEMRFKGPFALVFDSGLITKGYKVDDPDFSSMSLRYLNFQTSTSLRSYITQQFHASVYYEMSRVEQAVLSERGRTVELTDFGWFEDILEHSVGFGIGYRMSDSMDLGFKYVRGLTSRESLLLTQPNGQESGSFQEYSQYGQVYFTYYFYVNNWKGDLEK